MNEARVRLDLSRGEIEVAGDRAFVESWRPQIDAMLERLGEASPARTEPVGEPQRASHGDGPDLPSFGEWIQSLAAIATDVDRILAAGYWRQKHAADDAFQTSDANRLLLDHGVRVGNPSQSVKQNVNAKRIFSIGKQRYRVAHLGVDRLRELMPRELFDPAPR